MVACAHSPCSLIRQASLVSLTGLRLEGLNLPRDGGAKLSDMAAS